MAASIPVIYDLDERNEATGTVHFFCHEACRKASPLCLQQETVFGENPLWCVPDGTVCETCLNPVDRRLAAGL